MSPVKLDFSIENDIEDPEDARNRVQKALENRIDFLRQDLLSLTSSSRQSQALFPIDKALAWAVTLHCSSRSLLGTGKPQFACECCHRARCSCCSSCWRGRRLR